MSPLNNFKSFVNHYSKYIKNITLPICINEKLYDFEVFKITDESIHLRINLDYDSIFYSKQNSVEFHLKELIEEDTFGFDNSHAFHQRVVSKSSQFKNLSFKILIGSNEEIFRILSISQKFLTIGIQLDFDDFNNDADENIYFIVKDDLFSHKFEFDSLIEEEHLEKIRKEKVHRKKLYSKEYLSAISRKRRVLENIPFNVCILGNYCSFDFKNVDEDMVKLVSHFSLETIFESSPNSVEGKIKEFLLDIFCTKCNSIDEFSREFDKNKGEFLFKKISFSIGNCDSEFRLLTFDNGIKLVKFVRFEEMIKKFKDNEYCLETVLKKHIELYKPEHNSFHVEFVPPKNNKKEYRHPTVSNKENPEIVSKKIHEKREFRKKYDKTRSFNKDNRDENMNKLLR